MMDCWKFFSRSKVKCSVVHFYLGFEALFYFAYPFELLVHEVSRFVTYRKIMSSTILDALSLFH